MGYEQGTVIVWNKKFWLFSGYGKSVNMEETYRLHGLNGEVVEPLASECSFLISPEDLEY